jgi:hypothetical protein
MQNSKLIEVLKTLNTRESRQFRLFLASPYFNKNEAIIRLLEYLFMNLQNDSQLSRENVMKSMSTNELKIDDIQLNYLNSSLLSLVETFLGLEAHQKDENAAEFTILKALSTRGLDKNYRFRMDAQRRKLIASPLQDASSFFTRYQLEDLERSHFDRQGLRRLHESVQNAADNLDIFYLTEKLKYTCAIINSQQVAASTFGLNYVEEVRKMVANNPIPKEATGMSIYFHILNMNTNVDASEDFEVLKRLLNENKDRFPTEELAEMYQYALNFCIGQIRKTREKYVAEALDLYETGVETGILLKQGKLSPWHFKNIIKLALRQERYDWTEQFIHEKTKLLEDNFKTDALHYNLAELYFYTHRYDLALTHLNNVEFTDVHYNLGAKIMLGKIYFETDADIALDSLLKSFKIYLRRNKIISENVRQAYLNFISLLVEIVKLNKKQVESLREKIENTEPLTEKAWLLKVL